MLCIGVYGGHLGEKAISSITKFCQRQQNKKVFILTSCDEPDFILSYTNAKEDDGIFLVLMKESILSYCEKYGLFFDMILCLQAWSLLHEMSTYLKKEGVIILNSDDKKIDPTKVSEQCKVITCGLSKDANVTISSVCESVLLEHIQCCIQDTFCTVSGTEVEPQEFSVELDLEEKSVSGLLAAVTALMAGDMEISVLTDAKGTSKEKNFE